MYKIGLRWLWQTINFSKSTIAAIGFANFSSDLNTVLHMFERYWNIIAMIGSIKVLLISFFVIVDFYVGRRTMLLAESWSWGSLHFQAPPQIQIRCKMGSFDQRNWGWSCSSPTPCRARPMTSRALNKNGFMYCLITYL